MPVLTHGHQVHLLQGAIELFPAMIAAMDAAQHDVRLETYIFDFTATGGDVGAALVRAALRGVRVWLVVDGAGTSQIPADWRERFDAAGVQWRVFNPMGHLGMLLPSHWRRLHRKLCVVDAGTTQAVAFCGGINILDDYFDPNHGALKAPRFDFAVRVTGPLVAAMVEAMDSLWKRMQAVRNLRQHEIGAAVTSWVSARTVVQEDALPIQGASDSVVGRATMYRAALLLRDNVRNRKRIERAYLKAIGDAHHEIIIANAYFVPGGKLRHALMAAAQRGVKVRLLLQGRYEYFMQYHAARPVYSALLGAGVEIHEYSSSFLHAKVAVVDATEPQAWATVGSSNLDPLSLLLAREANIMVRSPEFAQTLRRTLVHAMAQDGQQINPADYANRPWTKRLLDQIAYALMRLALWSTGNRY
ncbi:MAG: cardiolipin synthase ClsB [Burkholderiaceae bacterium]